MANKQIKSATFKYIGRALPIEDAAAKVSGRLRYLADKMWKDMLYAKLLLADLPHGQVIEVDTSAAELPGVVKIYNCFNTPREKFNSMKWFVGQKGVEDQQLFAERIRYVGEPVAAVVAETKQLARMAAAKIKVVYEPLNHIIEPEAALDGRVAIHSDSSISNIDLFCGDEAARNQAFAEAYAVIEDRVETPKNHHAALETHVYLAEPNHQGGVTVYSPCHSVYQMRMNVSKITGLPFNAVRVIKPHTGGSFGGKQEVTWEPLVALAALETDRPVLLELDRRDSILATRTRTKTVGFVRTAADRQGRITAREIRVIVDTGAYTSNKVAISVAMGKKAFRLYRIPQQKYIAQAVHTNTPVSGAMRGYGSPQIHAITEINLDNLARQIGADPVEFRLKNLVHPFDQDLIEGPALGNARVRDCVIKGAEEFGWNNKWSRPKDAGRLRKGVGMACATHGNGYFGVFPDFVTMTLRMLEDGSLNLNACFHELGHGVITIMKQIVAEIMSVEPKYISIPEPDTSASPYDIGCMASRVTYVCGTATKRVAENLRSSLAQESAKVLNCSPDEIRFDNGMLWTTSRPEDKRSYGEIVSLIHQQRQVELIQTLTYKSQANPGSYSTNFVEVLVDTFTGMVEVTEVVAVHDIGRAINPEFVRGQIYGGIQMGMGMALYEDLCIDPEHGKPKGDTLSRYHLVNAPDMPSVSVFLLEDGEEYGPFGAKSVGELAAVAIAPAVVNAINNALGTNLTILPLTPERIVAALKPC